MEEKTADASVCPFEHVSVRRAFTTTSGDAPESTSVRPKGLRRHNKGKSARVRLVGVSRGECATDMANVARLSVCLPVSVCLCLFSESVRETTTRRWKR